VSDFAARAEQLKVTEIMFPTLKSCTFGVARHIRANSNKYKSSYSSAAVCGASVDQLQFLLACCSEAKDSAAVKSMQAQLDPECYD
jgi:hypothetical protein